MRMNFKSRMLKLQNALCCETLRDIALECGFEGKTPDINLLRWLERNRIRLRRKYEIDYLGDTNNEKRISDSRQGSTHETNERTNNCI